MSSQTPVFLAVQEDERILCSLQENCGEISMLRQGAKLKLCQLCSHKIMGRGLGFKVQVYKERWILKNRVKKMVESVGVAV